MKNTYHSNKAKNLVTFLILLFTILTGNAQTFQVSGSVTDEEQKPLSGATIIVKEINKGTISNFDGKFNLNLDSGNYTITVSYIGYVSSTKKIQVTDNQIINFNLTESKNILEEVLVSATRATSKTPIAFTNITKGELESQNLGQDLPILLDQLPSVITTSDAGAGVGYTGIRIRGSDATRINITINGIPYNDSESQGTYWVNMPDFSSSIEDIQVQRGVGTSTNGSGAFGASINVKTQNAKKDSYATTSHTIGSFNTKKHNLSIGTGLKNNFYAAARLSKISSDGYIDRSASDLSSFYTEAGYITEKTSLKAIVFGGHEITQQAWYGTPEAVINEDEEGIQTFLNHEGYSFSQSQIDNLSSNPGRTYNHYTYDNEVDNYKQTHYQLLFDHQINNSFSLNLSGNYTAGKGFFEQFKPFEEIGDYFPLHANADEEGSVVRRRWLDNDFYALVYYLNYKKDDLNLTLGGGYTKYDGDHFGEVIWDSFPTSIETESEYYRSIGQKEDFNTYIKAEYQLTESIYTFVDLQYRRVDYSSQGISSDLLNIDVNEKYSFFNPKLGLTYTFDNKNSVYGSYAVANREPNRDDLTKNPIKPKSEKLHDFEFGYKFKSKNLYVISNFYYMNYNDQLVLTGELDDVGDPIRQNVAKSHRAGIELQVGYKFSNQLKIDVNTTLSENKIDSFDYIIYDTKYDETTYDDVYYGPVVTEFENTDISFSPSVIAGSTITYNPKENITIAFISKYVGKQYLDNTSNDFKSLDAYFVNNLNASIKFNPNWIEEVSFNLLINNLFNELYSSNGYTYSYYYRPEASNDPVITEKFFYPQATRNFLLGMTLKF